jgi:hypothetical protein
MTGKLRSFDPLDSSTDDADSLERIDSHDAAVILTVVKVLGHKFGCSRCTGCGEYQGVPQGNAPAALFTEGRQEKLKGILYDRPLGEIADNLASIRS